MSIDISGNYNSYSNYTYAMGSTKQAAESKKADETVKTAENKKSQNEKVADYYNYLQKNFDCVRNGKVSISGSFLKECANDPEKAKSLEQDLSLFKELSEQGRKSAEAHCRSLGDTLISYDETWSYDSKGNLTMMAVSTATTGDAAKEAAEKKAAEEEKAKKKQEKKLADKKAEEKQAEKKEAEEKMMEKLGISKDPMAAVSDAYHLSFDQSI